MNALKKDTVLSTKIKNDKLFLSIVIPCWNCSETIERLLDSIVEQNPSFKFEVIIQDDYSSDNFMEKVEKYKDKLDIKYFKNKPREIHCPGNTRMDGLANTSGEWVTFIDNDDILEPNALSEFYNCVVYNHETTLVLSYFREYFPETDQYGKIYDNNNNITWLHGKFYNKEFLKKYEINFKEDLKSHEDLYFNQCVFSTIASENLNYSILNMFTYKWVYNPKSLSRSMFYNDVEFYIDIYYDEYIMASTDPWLKVYDRHPESRDKIFDRECYVLLYSFFYYQSLYMRNGFKHHKRNRDIFENFLNDIKKRYNATNNDIINKIYSNSDMYNKTRREAMDGCAGGLIECHTFKDFINLF